MFVSNYIGLVHRSELNLRDGLLQVAEHHKDDTDVEEICKELASWSEMHIKNLIPVVERYQEDKEDEPQNLYKELFHGTRTGGLGLIRDLHDLYLLAHEAELSYTVIRQAALALRDSELENICENSLRETNRQIKWIRTRIKQAAPQSLVAA